MDWSTLGATLAQLGLTGLGNTLAGPLGGAVGSALGKTVADALGVEPTPQAIQAAVQADPEAAKIVLAQIEADASRYAQDVADRQGARNMLIEVSHDSPWLAGVPVAVTVVSFALVAAIILSVGNGWLREDGILVGWVLGLGTGAANFWLGSSPGSARVTTTKQAAKR